MKIELPIEFINVEKDRIDKIIAKNCNFSRNDAQKIIVDYGVFVDDIKIRKANFIAKPNQKIKIENKIEKTINALPEDITINIIFENNDYLIVNKESNMVVHPAPGHKSKTLVNALLFYLKENISKLNNDNTRPGIVHRIDKDTSGLLVVAKNEKTHNYFSNLLKTKEIKREYIALVDGVISNEIIHIDAPIGRDTNNRQKYCVTSQHSKKAVSHIYVLKRFENKTLVKIQLETGRTHQIRVHLSYINHPVFGDEIYNKKIDDFNQRLHAFKLSFLDPDNKEKTFFAELPKEFLKNSGINQKNIEEAIKTAKNI